MQRLNWNLGLACAVIVLSACGGKTEGKDEDETSTSNIGDGDGDAAGDGDGDAAGDGDGDAAGDGDGDAAGDGDGDASPTSSGNKGEGCASVCAVAQACGVTDEDCVQSCTENVAVSNAGQDALAVCFEDLSCTASETELFDAFLCVSEELEDTPLSDEQGKFCDETSPKVRACTGGEPDTRLGDCASQIGLISDELLEEINGCDQTDCDALETCVGLQVFQGIDLSAVTAVTSSGEVTAGGLSDLMALFVIANQLGTEFGLEGVGGGFGAP